MNKKTIGVLRGGISTEREVSLNSGKEMIEYLNKDKYIVKDIVVNSKKDLIDLEDIDFALLALHGKFGEDGEVQAILEAKNIPYSGANLLSSAICMDKDITKRILRTYDIRTANWASIRSGEKVEWNDIKHLGQKVIVKPNSGGSSVGVSFATNDDELQKALNEVFDIDKEAIIEEILDGMEISVPILDGKVYPIMCIEPQAGEFFDYKSKYEQGGAKEYPINFDSSLQKEIEDMTKKAFYATKIKSYARIDFMFKDDKPYLVEINTLPGMTSASIMPKSLESVGVSFSDLLDLLINVSIKHK